MSDRVEVRIEDHIADVMLNRPYKFNALDVETFAALDMAARSLGNEPSVRAVVLHGAGDHFCAGIDLAELRSGGEAVARSLLSPVEGSPANLAQRAAYAWRELPMPVICAVQGTVFGGGFQIAMGADLRYASEDASFSIMESKWGLIPDMGISTTLRGLLPPDKVKELAWTARVFDAAEALDLGLVTGVEDDPLAAACAMAETLRDRSPDAIRGIKRLANASWHLAEDAALALEMQIQVGILQAPNQAEAMRANLEKRSPEFVD